MGKYFKSFEDMKSEFVTVDGELKDVIDDDKNAQEDYSRRSRFGRNPESNVMDFERRNWYGTYDDYIEIVVCSSTKQ